MKAAIVGGGAVLAVAVASLAMGAAGMKITSTAFSEGGNIPSKFACDGGNTSPPLQIEGAPAEAKSLLLLVDDPDAPSGLFTHWLVWNIDPKATQIGEGTSPAGAIQGKNDFGKQGYGGPCPPSGTHRYYFRIFALDRTLDLKPGAKRGAVDGAMRGHVLARGELMGRYTKK